MAVHTVPRWWASSTRCSAACFERPYTSCSGNFGSGTDSSVGTSRYRARPNTPVVLTNTKRAPDATDAWRTFSVPSTFPSLKVSQSVPTPTEAAAWKTSEQPDAADMTDDGSVMSPADKVAPFSSSHRARSGCRTNARTPQPSSRSRSTR